MSGRLFSKLEHFTIGLYTPRTASIGYEPNAQAIAFRETMHSLAGRGQGLVECAQDSIIWRMLLPRPR